MKRRGQKMVVMILIVSLLVVTGCGSLVYPERIGQSRGNIDPIVVLMDGGLLLIGIVPGLIAFAVDFYNHTIYLPEGGENLLDYSHSSPEKSDMRLIYKGDVLTFDRIEEVLSRETGEKIYISQVQWGNNYPAHLERVHTGRVETFSSP